MIKMDENALICDLAETYQIYDYRKLPPLTLAVFAVGLRDDSRIKIIISGSKVSTQTMLLAGVLDRLNLIIWQKTEDGSKGRNRPKPVLDWLQEKESDVSAFTTGKDFEEERQRIVEKGGN